MRTCPYFLRFDALFGDIAMYLPPVAPKTASTKKAALAAKSNDQITFAFDFRGVLKAHATKYPEISPTDAQSSGASPREPVIASSSESAPSRSTSLPESSQKGRAASRAGKKSARPPAESPVWGADKSKARGDGGACRDIAIYPPPVGPETGASKNVAQPNDQIAFTFDFKEPFKAYAVEYLQTSPTDAQPPRSESAPSGSTALPEPSQQGLAASRAGKQRARPPAGSRVGGADGFEFRGDGGASCDITMHLPPMAPETGASSNRIAFPFNSQETFKAYTSKSPQTPPTDACSSGASPRGPVVGSAYSSAPFWSAALPEPSQQGRSRAGGKRARPPADGPQGGADELVAQGDGGGSRKRQNVEAVSSLLGRIENYGKTMRAMSQRRTATDEEHLVLIRRRMELSEDMRIREMDIRARGLQLEKLKQDLLMRYPPRPYRDAQTQTGPDSHSRSWQTQTDPDP